MSEGGRNVRGIKSLVYKWANVTSRGGFSVRYVVQAVEVGELPAGIDKVIVERDGELPLLLVSGEPARTWALMRAWESTQEPCTVPTICVPAPRLLRAV